ncbi:hypothetical protein BDU57DRAFT_566612 [Ampelomyces quisqualis]|uniref:Uncharacterized protein n=1 Tax=Ampelomyces quisqualis TaxID=50730 RepID=A0A6A5Q529_AMPQU|nr:hypothetical protein BDU57DRAFT_566612 [Ampelomyces quisqualis]
MAGRDKTPEIGRNNDEISSRTAALWSPVQLSSLDTPNSTSSLTCSPSDLTPPVAAFEKLEIASSKIHTHHKTVANMDINDGSSWECRRLVDGPPADLHTKHLEETQRRSRTSAMSSIHAAFNSSKKLQQMLGLQSPEPYARPPPKPSDLELRFEAGAHEYGLDFHLPEGSLFDTLEQAANAQKNMNMAVNLGNAVLNDIKEETESPVKATHAKVGSGEASGGLTITPPVWSSEYEAIGGTEHTGPIEAQEDGAETEYEDDGFTFGEPYAGFGSTTTLADSDASRPGTSAAAEHNGLTVNPVANSTYTVTQDGTHHGYIGAGYKPPPRGSSLANLAQHRAYSTADGNHVYGQTHMEGPEPYYAPVRNASAPMVLFPSPRVEQKQSWHADQIEASEAAPQGFEFNEFALHGRTEIPAPAGFVAQLPKTFAVPQISIRSPSPEKLPDSKKRSAASQGAPPTKHQPDDTTVGLPILAPDQEPLWKAPFPGNTQALLTILLPWSISLHRLFKAYPDPYLFSINLAFPYPIAPPHHTKLISAAFYDTRQSPHKETRFLGPTDCAEISYNEVDIFRVPRPVYEQPCELQEHISVMKRARGHKAQTMADHGEGRWSYILMQGHRRVEGEIAPHMVIAWPREGTTGFSECLHTVYPDDERPALAVPKRASKRFTSLQNLRLRRDLRAASSGEELPRPVVEVGKQEGALTLKRQVLKMEKGGRIPLIEGYRVDVKRWEEWLGAVGEGKGKIILWMDRE